MCGCNSSIGNCNCSCAGIIIPQVAGPTGATGPAGTTILDWTTSTLSTVTTGSDVLLYSYTLAAGELPTDGDELEIVITGAWLNNAIRYLKIDLNASTITTAAQCTGAIVNGVFVCKATITRVSNILTEGFAITHWNTGSTTQSLVTFPFVTDFASSQSIRFYVNQDVASSVRIDSIKIKKSIS